MTEYVRLDLAQGIVGWHSHRDLCLDLATAAVALRVAGPDDAIVNRDDLRIAAEALGIVDRDYARQADTTKFLDALAAINAALAAKEETNDAC